VTVLGTDGLMFSSLTIQTSDELNFCVATCIILKC